MESTSTSHGEMVGVMDSGENDDGKYLDLSKGAIILDDLSIGVLILACHNPYKVGFHPLHNPTN